MKKLFSLLLAFVLVVSMTTPVSAEVVTISTEEKLVEAVTNGGNFKLETDIELTSRLTVPSGVTLTLDLNGHTISNEGTSSNSNYNLFTNKGNFTVTDSVGGGKITLKATANHGWNRSSTIISNESGVLTILGGTLEHLGGSDMAYVIDNNSTNGETTVNIQGGTLITPYRAVRAFQNHTTKQNTINITGGTLQAKACVWMQQPGASATLGTLNISGNANLEGVANAVVVDICGAAKTDVTIKGGTFSNTSTTANLLLVWPLTDMSAVKTGNHTSLDIQGGIFDCTGEGKLIGLLDGADANTTVTVSGGIFSEETSVKEYVTSGKELAQNLEGLWVAHTHDTDVVIPAVDATCTTEGSTAGSECSVCGKVMVAPEVIGKTEHTVKNVGGVDATCTTAGNTAGTKCDVCGTVLSGLDTIEALGHTLKVIPGTPATCTESGISDGSECTVCGTVVKAQQTIAPTHTLVKVEAKEPSYTEAGWEAYEYCTACDYTTYVELAKLEQVQVDVVVSTPAEGEETPAEVEVKVEVKEEAVDEVIEKAVEEAKTEEKAPVVVIDVKQEAVEAVKKQEETVKEEDVKVSEVTIPTATLEKVAEVAEDSALEVNLTTATVTMDNKALESVATEAEGSTIELHVEHLEVEELLEEQQAAIEDKAVALTISAKLICSETKKEIGKEANGGFNGGKVTVAVPLPTELPENIKVEDLGVYYVADEGTVTSIESEVEDGHIVFDLQHFSEYVIAAERPTTPTVVTGNNNALMYGALAVVLVLGMAIVMKKRKTA